MSEQPHHVSVYDLQVEQRTAFGRWYTPGVHPLPSEAAAVDMLRAASTELRGAGYEHYEISNFGASVLCRLGALHSD